MKKLILISCLLLAAAPVQGGGQEPVVLPDSPAGRCAAAYFQAFASGDDGQMEAFIKKYRPKSYIDGNPIEKQIRFYRMVYSNTGPLIPTGCKQVSENEIIVVVRSRKDSSMLYTVSFKVDAGEPHYLTELSINRGAAEGDLEIDPALVDKTIDQLAQILNQKYVIPELGEKMAVALLGNKTAGHYRKYTNGVQLANKLIADLVSLSQDKHIHIGFGPLPREEAAPVDSPEIDSSWGFTEVKIIDSNIGYIRLDKFCDPERAKGAAARAMSIVAGCDALIFDLRNNPGGAPGVDLLLASYLFEKPTLFGSRYSRLDNSTQDFYTFKDISGKPFGPKKPVYVLTSSMTFSAAEAFTYCLQDLKRATVVGERTHGGAHPVIAIAVNEKFWMGLPYARAIGPVGKRDWEGVGVIPDISVPADEALAAALKDAAGRKKPSPVLAGPYLGQKPPGLTPEVFAPGIVSRGYFERSVVFSPDHDELFFQLRCLGFTTVLIHMKTENKTWTLPETACFSGIPEYSDAYAFFAYDGRRLFISSRRPLPGQKEINKYSDIWFLQKDKEEWASPIHGGEILNSMVDDDYPTLSKFDNLYFSSNRDGNYDIYVSHFSEKGFSEPINLDGPINTQHFEGHPFIAADESYLIFSADRPGQLGDGDLYISFKSKKNEWLEPVNMGDKINSSFHDVAPYVSPDGQYLFFCSFRPNPQPTVGKRLTFGEIQALLDGPGNGRGDIYWISAKIIEELRPKK